MQLQAHHRKFPEWPLFILVVMAVLAVCIPLRQMFWPAGDTALYVTTERLAHLLLGPEQIVAYIFFAWAGVIIVTHYREVRRQRRAFALDLLPNQDDLRILPEDTILLQRRVEQVSTGAGPYLLTRMIGQALGCFGMTRSSQDARQAIQNQAEVDLSRMAASMSTVHYLAWSIPALGFIGTARGIGLGLAVAAQTDLPFDEFVGALTKNISVTFDTTLMALLLSVIVMFFIYSVQRAEELLVLDCQQYCLDFVVKRFYSLPPLESVSAGSEPSDTNESWSAGLHLPV